ncbi:hypothetical protein L0657_23510 [Dyadobacter sp. CY345]|uniref:M43 family zinc metalloprotease n=1 Tax=Dyadobacter sp. CY345 TaxID=2909335 RepID=UPI001EEDB088|nr:M43 family zinc metalloprotease [Dyadobacter sp. CY345]MCF2446942.1 hypothetical protein [Dyadobacter sp. CY345]
MVNISTGKSRLKAAALLVLSTCSVSLAQDRVFRVFNTQTVLAATQKQHPEYAKKLESFENAVAELTSSGEANQVCRVPVLFHLLGADAAKLPDESQVRFQLEVLNKYFGSYEPDQTKGNEAIEKFSAFGASPDIQFYIPEAFAGVKGINIVKTNKNIFDITNQMQDPKSGGFAAVDANRIVNIWVGNLDGYNAGYAQLPGAPRELDGIVIDPDFFGNEKGTAKAPYTQGKTLVHLMGSYLGLYELWNQENPCADDHVMDTPPHGGPTQEVDIKDNLRVITTCHGYILAMFMNFMDNTDDQYMSMFTKGQKDRMRATLAEGAPRNGLVTK